MTSSKGTIRKPGPNEKYWARNWQSQSLLWSHYNKDSYYPGGFGLTDAQFDAMEKSFSLQITRWGGAIPGVIWATQNDPSDPNSLYGNGPPPEGIGFDCVPFKLNFPDDRQIAFARFLGPNKVDGKNSANSYSGSGTIVLSQQWCRYLAHLGRLDMYDDIFQHLLGHLRGFSQLNEAFMAHVKDDGATVDAQGIRTPISKPIFVSSDPYLGGQPWASSVGWENLYQLEQGGDSDVEANSGATQYHMNLKFYGPEAMTAVINKGNMRSKYELGFYSTMGWAVGSYDEVVFESGTPKSYMPPYPNGAPQPPSSSFTFGCQCKQLTTVVDNFGSRENFPAHVIYAGQAITSSMTAWIASQPPAAYPPKWDDPAYQAAWTTGGTMEQKQHDRPQKQQQQQQQQLQSVQIDEEKKKEPMPEGIIFETLKVQNPEQLQQQPMLDFVPAPVDNQDPKLSPTTATTATTTTPAADAVAVGAASKSCCVIL